MALLMDGIWRMDSLRIGQVMAIGLLGILVAAPSASGQAAIDQYVPQANPAGGSVGSARGPTDTLGPGGAQVGLHKITTKRAEGSANGGKLPGTDYPVTPFVWVVLAALAVGVLVRVAAPMLGRRGAQDAA
jgi:hypothetical protein